MASPMPADQLLKRAASILPISDEDLIYKGVVAGVSERLFTLKRRRSQLERKHGSIYKLETRLKIEGVTPDNHTLYTDLLEWRAIDHELSELLVIFEAV
jgi:hypothetical protein